MKKILVIDDDFVACAQAKYALEDEYEIIIASSAQAAPKIMRILPFDLILLDIYMPGINGMDFLKQLIQKEEHPPVILITSDDTVETEIEGLNAGAADFIHKPCSPDVLKARVGRVITEVELMKEFS